MHNSKLRFLDALQSAKTQSGLYNFLTNHVKGPHSYDDILRFQIVFAVSAFDKLIHDLIRVGMVEMFVGQRAATPKYMNDVITLHLHGALTTSTLPPPEVIFEQDVIRRLKVNSYQDPVKIAEGLSYIWDEKHKWQKIADEMALPRDLVTTRLKLIASRRNAIVHEADMDPLSHSKNEISKSESEDVLSFLENCGKAIVKMVQ